MTAKTGYIQALVRHIEDNLANDLDTGQLSAAGFVSRAQLYRDFYSATGHSVKEYIRKRRLSNALALIKMSGVPLADIAYRCGYSSQQALCRAVRDRLGLTPTAYQHGDTHYFFPPYDGYAAWPVTVAAEQFPATVCVRYTSSSSRQIESRAVGALLSCLPGYGGKLYGKNGDRRDCYDLYVETPDTDTLRAGGFAVLPGPSASGPRSRLYAASTVPNQEEKITAAWDNLCNCWLPASMFTHSAEPFFEEYLLRNGKAAKLKLYLPIAKRREEVKITLTESSCPRFLAATAYGAGAERAAAKRVMDFLTERYPQLLRSQREFLLRRDIEYCVCGVALPESLTEAGEGIDMYSPAEGPWLVLASECTGDYDLYADQLLAFARSNGMAADENSLFAVYDARKGFDSPGMKMYLRIRR